MELVEQTETTVSESFVEGPGSKTSETTKVKKRTYTNDTFAPYVYEKDWWEKEPKTGYTYAQSGSYSPRNIGKPWKTPNMTRESLRDYDSPRSVTITRSVNYDKPNEGSSASGQNSVSRTKITVSAESFDKSASMNDSFSTISSTSSGVLRSGKRYGSTNARRNYLSQARSESRSETKIKKKVTDQRTTKNTSLYVNAGEDHQLDAPLFGLDMNTESDEDIDVMVRNVIGSRSSTLIDTDDNVSNRATKATGGTSRLSLESFSSVVSVWSAFCVLTSVLFRSTTKGVSSMFGTMNRTFYSALICVIDSEIWSLIWTSRRDVARKRVCCLPIPCCCLLLLPLLLLGLREFNAKDEEKIGFYVSHYFSERWLESSYIPSGSQDGGFMGGGGGLDDRNIDARIRAIFMEMYQEMEGKQSGKDKHSYSASQQARLNQQQRQFSNKLYRNLYNQVSSMTKQQLARHRNDPSLRPTLQQDSAFIKQQKDRLDALDTYLNTALANSNKILKDLAKDQKALFDSLSDRLSRQQNKHEAYSKVQDELETQQEDKLAQFEAEMKKIIADTNIALKELDEEQDAQMAVLSKQLNDYQKHYETDFQANQHFRVDHEGKIAKLEAYLKTALSNLTKSPPGPDMKNANVHYESLREGISKVTVIGGNDDLAAKLAAIEASLDSLFADIASMKTCCTTMMSKQQVDATIQEALLIFGADRTGLMDYAAESGGGSIASIRCTETFDTNPAVLSLFGIPLMYLYNSPRTVIQPGADIGECWPFKGSVGHIVFRLGAMINPTSFTYEHLPKFMAPDGDIHSAPRDFSVFGLQSVDDHSPLSLGNYTYNEDGEPRQNFRVQAMTSRPFRYIELEIKNNWGKMEYTCLYRFRIHGNLAKGYAADP